MANKIKLKKTLYVGVGGTGVDTLLQVKKCFIDIYGEVPPMIGILAIDTDGGANSKHSTSNRGEKILLIPSEILVCTVKGALNAYHNNPTTYSWVPSNNVGALRTIQGNGAGQVRSNGRFIAYYNNKSIKDHVQAAVTKITSVLPLESRYEVDIDKDGLEYAVDVNIVGSVAGGTGSGMLIDVICLINQALELKGVKFHVCPWIVLPEIFMSIATGPAMACVDSNTYGALCSLDYLVHHEPTAHPINFGFAQIKEPLFDYAYIINNTNSTGTTFTDKNDLTEVIAKRMYLPANPQGADTTSVYDNIVSHQSAGIFDILNKKAWAASVGSAELVYDSQVVANAYAHQIIQQLCANMLNGTSQGAREADNMFDDQEVSIRENNGKDDIINALLNPEPTYDFVAGIDTTESEIAMYLDEQSNVEKLEDELKDKLKKKLNEASIGLEHYLKKIMANDNGKVADAIDFVESVNTIIDICRDEMTEEGKKFRTLNSVPINWHYLIEGCKNTGLARLMGSRNEEGIELLEAKVREVARNRREEIRREWAQKFYNTFQDEVNKNRSQLNALKNTLEAIRRQHNEQLVLLRRMSQSDSKFQIYFHKDDVIKASYYQIEEAIITGFTTYLSEGTSEWIGLPEDKIEKSLWKYAEGIALVQKALGTDIESVIQKMSEEEVKSYIERLKILAAPLWNHDTQGYNPERSDLARIVVVGVNNRDKSILRSDAYMDLLNPSTTDKASFASTNQKDRIYLMIIENLLPIYAVNNFKTYEIANEKLEKGVSARANYID